MIVSPLGEVLAGPIYDKEAVITADIDLSDTIRGKYDLDVVGHYARPDIFKLSVDKTPKQSVAYHNTLDDQRIFENQSEAPAQNPD